MRARARRARRGARARARTHEVDERVAERLAHVRVEAEHLEQVHHDRLVVQHEVRAHAAAVARDGRAHARQHVLAPRLGDEQLAHELAQLLEREERLEHELVAARLRALVRLQVEPLERLVLRHPRGLADGLERERAQALDRPLRVVDRHELRAELGGLAVADLHAALVQAPRVLRRLGRHLVARLG